MVRVCVCCDCWLLALFVLFVLLVVWLFCVFAGVVGFAFCFFFFLLFVSFCVCSFFCRMHCLFISPLFDLRVFGCVLRLAFVVLFVCSLACFVLRFFFFKKNVVCFALFARFV